MALHARGSRSNNALLVVECDRPIDPERVRRALDRFLDVCPWPGARLHRPFPWGRLHWAAGSRESLARPPVRRQAVATPEALHRALTDELDTPIDPEREAPLRVLLLDGPDPSRARGVLVLTWFHPLMDPRGGQNLLAHLCQLDGHAGASPWGATPPVFVPPEDRRPLRERARIARRGVAYLKTLAPEPPVSPGPPDGAPGRARFRCETFAVPDGNGAGPRSREISWRLAVVGRAMASLWKGRGLPDVPFLLPIAVDLRPKGDPGPTFGNLLAFHFARFRPSDTADLLGLAGDLRRKLAEAIREGQIEASEAGMEFLRYRPVGSMLRSLPWTKGGEIFSFNCADVTDFPPAIDRCFGRRVVNAYHVPAMPVRPGIGVFFNRCAGLSNLVVSWVEGVVSEEEAAGIIESVAEGMGWRTRH
jgi:hypothetical protein